MRASWRNLLLGTVAALSLGVIVLYAVARFTAVPYTGFTLGPNTGVISVVIAGNPNLQSGDKIEQIAGTPWNSYSADRSQPLLVEYSPGQQIPLQVLREGQVVETVWQMPHPDLHLYLDRLFGVWIVGPFFWVFGMLTMLVIRPRDSRWALMAAFFFLIAVLLAVGGHSLNRVWYSALVYRALTWPALVVAWHFHWVFPTPLSPWPGVHHRWPLAVGYVIACLLAAAEVFQLLPGWMFALANIMILAGSLGLLVAHAVRQPVTRRELHFLAIMLATLLALIGALNWLAMLLDYAGFSYSIFLVISLIPLAYFYVTYHSQPGGMEVRTNRFIAFLVFALGLIALALLGAGTVILLTADPTRELLYVLLWVLLVGLAGSMLYPRFRRWFERRVLNLVIPADELVATIARLVSTSPNRENLAAVLTGQVFPSLMIRQAAVVELVDLNPQGVPRRLNPVALLGVTAAQLPVPEAIPGLLARAGKVRSQRRRPPEEWILLALPLEYLGRPVGLCLLGRRDPDDSYPQAELPILQTLMTQTAMVLVNTGQAELIHALQRYEIERREEEYRRLAHDLHDDVLGQMALVAHHVDPENRPFRQAQEAAVQRVRDLIAGLRPATLSLFGLYPALQELIDELEARAAQSGQKSLVITLDMDPHEARYPVEVELALYRIVQQAGQNAIKHAAANLLSFRGMLAPGCVELCVEDNGRGFAAFARSELTPMLVHQHFGLLNMYERADLVGAQLQIDSAPGRGTRVKVVWQG